MRLALIPLDERPCNEYFPRALAPIAGAQVITPPAHLLPTQREVGDYQRLGQWLDQVAPEVDGVIVSIETLAYGGLIPSRITDTSLNECLARLESLRKIKDEHQDLVIYAFNLVMRISNSNVNFEEP